MAREDIEHCNQEHHRRCTSFRSFVALDKTRDVFDNSRVVAERARTRCELDTAKNGRCNRLKRIRNLVERFNDVHDLLALC